MSKHGKYLWLVVQAGGGLCVQSGIYFARCAVFALQGQQGSHSTGVRAVILLRTAYPVLPGQSALMSLNMCCWQQLRRDKNRRKAQHAAQEVLLFPVMAHHSSKLNAMLGAKKRFLNVHYYRAGNAGKLRDNKFVTNTVL